MHDQAFLHAIGDSPDDDAPRLVYADWLEEHGQAERAEFIRVQIDLAKGQRRTAASLSRREKELQFQYGDSWSAELPEFEGIRWGDFERGFIDSVSATTSDVFVKHAVAIFAATPIRRAEVKAIVLSKLRRFAICPLLGRLTHLDVSGQTQTACVPRLLALSPRLSGLCSFRASDCGLADADLAAMTAAFARLEALDELILSSNQIGSEGVQALAASRHLTHLTRLVLSHNRIGMEGARDLARSGNLPNLKTLYLNSNPIDALGRRLLRQRFGAKVCRF